MSTGPVVEDIAWYRIDEAATAGTARRAAADAAARLGLTPTRAGEIAIAVAEVAGNLHKHAEDGSLLLRTVIRDGTGGIEIVALDRGPGMADMRVSTRDGHSTAGTLGYGLGAIERLATYSRWYSVPGRGSVFTAQFWPAGHDAAGARPDGLTRPITGERVCGDRFAVAHTDRGLLAMVGDGLGHGALAAAASAAAVEAFCAVAAAGTTPAAAVEAIHRRLAGTRGAAVAVACLDTTGGPDAAVVRFAGLGNVSGHIATPGQRRSMASLPGIAGHNRRAVREFEYPLPSGAFVVLHSDGLTERWSLDGYPGVWDRDPVLVAAVLLRDAGIRHDDAGVLVIRHE